MGACCSAPHDRPSQALDLAKRPSPYDSVWSVTERQQDQQGQPHEKQQSKGRTGAKHAQKQAQQTSSQQQQQAAKQKLKRMLQVDMSTGEVIPDFGVYGVFDVLYELGSGGSGQTYLCRDMASGKVVAVKFVPRPLSKSAIPFMLAEVEIQAELGEGNLNLISMHEIILTSSHLALVLEYASGGSLTEKVACLWESALQRGGLFMEEQEASYYLRQFVHCIHYCHKHRVAHRDLKLDNTLLEQCIIGPSRLKICDFGFARRWIGEKDTMHDAIGTPVYMSPQMLASRQCASGYSGIKADMWAMGILLFVMLLGSFPFDHDAHEDPNSPAAADEVWLKQQQQGWRKNPRTAEVLRHRVLSDECCDLLDKLLMVDEDKRVSSGDILDHPWLNIPLLSEHQEAWERLQQEQADLDKQLKRQANPRLAKLRKEAMIAMMAIAAKPPGRTLFPDGTTASGSLHTSTSAGSGDYASSDSSSAFNAAVDPPAAAAAAQQSTTDVEGGDDLVCNDNVAHMSFTSGEGVGSNALVDKVEAYRQQQAAAKQARAAATMAAVQEGEHSDADKSQQQLSGHDVSQRSGSRRSTSSSNDSTAAAADRSTSPRAATGTNTGTTGTARSVKEIFSRKDTSTTASSKAARSPFAGVTGSANPSAAAAPAGSEETDADADSDAPDEVWRLPLTSTVDASVYKLTPELTVAAGALIRQLQKSGEKIAGRGRSSRSSCPMY